MFQVISNVSTEVTKEISKQKKNVKEEKFEGNPLCSSKVVLFFCRTVQRRSPPMVGWCSNHRPRTHTKKVPRANFKLTKSKHPENGKTAKGMFKKGGGRRRNALPKNILFI